METVLAMVSVLIALVISLYFSLKPRPLPGIPHNDHLPWALGDMHFFSQAWKESGRIIRGGELLAERFGPISQVS